MTRLMTKGSRMMKRLCAYAFLICASTLAVSAAHPLAGTCDNSPMAKGTFDLAKSAPKTP